MSEVLSTDAIKAMLKSQFHAHLKMLRSTIEQCPEELWVSRDYLNPVWRVAYHLIYFAHLYMQPRFEDFQPWEKHQTFLQDMDDVPAPPEYHRYAELPHRPPQTGVPLTKDEMLEYWTLVDGMVDDTIDSYDLTATSSGFSWYPIPKLEHQMVTLRHIAHHTGQLMDRLRKHADIGVEWIGRNR